MLQNESTMIHSEQNQMENNNGVTTGQAFRFGPVPEFSAYEISGIRSQMGISRDEMATFMGVTKKTVASWENGRTTPRGPARRLLGMINTKSPLHKAEGASDELS